MDFHAVLNFGLAEIVKLLIPARELRKHVGGSLGQALIRQILKNMIEALSFNAGLFY